MRIPRIDTLFPIGIHKRIHNQIRHMQHAVALNPPMVCGIVTGGEKIPYCRLPENLRISICNVIAMEAIPPLSPSLWACVCIDKNGNE
ncbi:hypothetical protein HJB79_04430 [Rhizobium lentis]|uniref:hypothetical protein n=1 Tax=Rhizobium lentis TaxID=1138194 RepID=UPI001C83EB84|nr:hypothetical protein [Rhizobium lentis]MBX5138054.1 hypothetical protein [Rhizobium lentis]MBX5151156.1 hypothetical protein [Rhizobium lentis]